MNQAILVLQNDGDERQIESADAGLVRLWRGTFTVTRAGFSHV